MRVRKITAFGLFVVLSGVQAMGQNLLTLTTAKGREIRIPEGSAVALKYQDKTVLKGSLVMRQSAFYLESFQIENNNRFQAINKDSSVSVLIPVVPDDPGLLSVGTGRCRGRCRLSDRMLAFGVYGPAFLIVGTPVMAIARGPKPALYMAIAGAALSAVLAGGLYLKGYRWYRIRK